MKYHIVTMEGCSYCDKAKELMDKAQVGYVEYSAKGLILRLMASSGFKTVPQIWNEKWEHVGGYTHLKDLLKEKKCSELPVK